MTPFNLCVAGFLWLLIKSCALQNITLHDDEFRIVTLPANGTLVLQVTSELLAVAFVCQAHSQLGKITLSTESSIKHDTSVMGRDVGVVKLYKSPTDLFCYLISNSILDMEVLVHVRFLSDKDPLPGGCNQEFNLENDPNIHLNVQELHTNVEFQWSNTGWAPDGNTYPDCETVKYQSSLVYEVYVHYLTADDFSEDSYFSNLKLMMSPDNVLIHGTLVKRIVNTQGQKSMLDVSSYSGRGVVYTVMVSLGNHANQATYIPVVSYGCDIDNKPSCKHRDIATVLFATIFGLLGLFLCVQGHRYFKTENFIFGFVIFALIFYQVLALKTTLSFVATLVLGAMFGIAGGSLLLVFWWYLGIPILNVLLIGLVMGYLVTSVVFYTPFGNLDYWDSAFNYGAAFACGVLIIPVIMLTFTRFLNIFTCVLVGSYAVIVMFNVYLNSGMHIILVNSLRHGTNKAYLNVIITQPFTSYEIALTVIWILSVIVGVAVNVFHERRNAPFPPCPYHVSTQNRLVNAIVRPRSIQSSDTERLLKGNNHMQYGSSNVTVHEESTYEQDEGSYRQLI